MVIDPRKVKIPGKNLTVIYMENGVAHQLLVADMEHVHTPIEHFTFTAPAECWGIYNERGEELWPSNCEAPPLDVKPQTATKLGAIIKRTIKESK